MIFFCIFWLILNAIKEKQEKLTISFNVFAQKSRTFSCKCYLFLKKNYIIVKDLFC